MNEIYDFEIVIFDLDNTIFNEDDYLISAYLEIAEFVASRTNNFSKSVLFSYLKREYYLNGRCNLFDKFKRRFNLTNIETEDILQILRTLRIVPKLTIYNKIYSLLLKLQNNKTNICIATNGNKVQQQNKINNIEWGEIDISKIKKYFAIDYLPKPSPLVILGILNDFALSHDNAIFVGDSEVDLLSATAASVKFLHVNNILK